MAEVAGADAPPAAPDRGRVKSLVLIGFMGAGKSSAARAAAVTSDPVDLDALLERRLGMSVAEYFERHGEVAFRAKEEELACEVLDGSDAEVIALGGGAVGSERVREALGRNVVALLDVGVEEAWSRVAGDPRRPLAQDRRAFERLYAERASTYEGLADAVVVGGSSAQVAEAIGWLAAEASRFPDARMLWASSASGSYPAWFGTDIIGAVPTRASGRSFCVTDENVGPIYSERVAAEATVAVNPGEASKSIGTAELIWGALARAGARRDDHLVALGGGVVGDLAGFCAATYQRGIPVVQIPTSLVGQVDSAFGGKTGVDLPEAKNYVGAYHQPAGVVCDLQALTTLPPAELAAGWAEVVKTALIAGGRLWQMVSAFDASDLGNPSAMEPIVFECARTKVEVVAADERDSGRRAVLNLGHTVAHAIETATDYARYRHGEAVALGLLAALRLSGASELRDEVSTLVEAVGLPTRLDAGVDPDELLEAMRRDKKSDAEGVRFVTCGAPGEVTWGHRFSDSDVLAAVSELARSGRDG